MKTLRINAGYIIPTEDGYRRITGRHFDQYTADNFVIDDDGNETKTGSVILTASEIKNAIHEATGKAFDLVEYED